MKKIAYFDCYSGASGDMLLGALLDKAVDFDWFKNSLDLLALPRDSFKIEKTYVERNSINTCKINITISTSDNHHRSYNSILKIIENSGISEKAKILSKKIFETLANAESTIHNKDINEIHFHEVGAIDSIIDIVGFSICFTSLEIDKCIVSPLPTGYGKVRCNHGYLPVPAPAVLEIIKVNEVPIKNNYKINGECLTPTGTAILSTVANKYSYSPSMNKILSIGYGAGDRIFEEITSNLRLIIGLSEV